MAALPHGGLDVQEERLYWALPDGRVVCWSLRELAEVRPDELAPQDSEEACRSVAAEFGYDVLGCAGDAEILLLREDPGTLADSRWTPLEAGTRLKSWRRQSRRQP